MPWEYYERMRPWIQVYFLEGFRKVFVFCGIENAYSWTLGFRMIMALIACLGQFLVARSVFNKNYFYLITFHLSSSLIFPIAFFSIRPSSESLSFYTLIIGWSIYLIKVLPNPNKANKFYSLFSILLICLSIQIKYQMALIVLPLFIWLIINSPNRKNLFANFFFISLIQTLLCIWLDSYSYNNYYTLSPWNYFEANILRNISSDFGVHSFSEYLKSLSQESYGILLLLFLIILLKKQPSSWLIFFSLPYLLIHHFIGHKELRFLIPIILLFNLYMLVVIKEYYYAIKKIPTYLLKLSLFVISIGLFLDFTINLTKQLNTYDYFRSQVNKYVPKNAEVTDLYGDPYNLTVSQPHGLGGVLKNNFTIQNSVQIKTALSEIGTKKKGYWIVRDHSVSPDFKQRLLKFSDCILIYRQPKNNEFLINVLKFMHHTEVYYLFKCNS